MLTDIFFFICKLLDLEVRKVCHACVLFKSIPFSMYLHFEKNYQIGIEHKTKVLKMTLIWGFITDIRGKNIQNGALVTFTLSLSRQHIRRTSPLFYCQIWIFWIYWVGANTKFTVWHLHVRLDLLNQSKYYRHCILLYITQAQILRCLQALVKVFNILFFYFAQS